MRRVIGRRAALALVLATPFLARPALARDRALIVAVNYPLAYMAQRLAGEGAEVLYPVPAGTDPSFWRPSISDISRIQSADLILLNGAGFATWTDKVSLPRARIVAASRAFEDRLIATQSITHSHGDGGEHSHEGTASYVWLDLGLAAQQAQAVADALVARALAPDDVDARLATLLSDLDRLDAHVRARLASIREVPLIATHPRYQYLAEAYALDIRALEWDAGAAPDPAQLSDLRSRLDAAPAGVLLWEADPGTEARAAVTDLGLQDVVFPPLATPPEGGDFLSIFRASVDALTEAATRAAGG